MTPWPHVLIFDFEILILKLRPAAEPPTKANDGADKAEVIIQHDCQEPPEQPSEQQQQHQEQEEAIKSKQKQQQQEQQQQQE